MNKTIEEQYLLLVQLLETEGELDSILGIEREPNSDALIERLNGELQHTKSLAEVELVIQRWTETRYPAIWRAGNDAKPEPAI